MEENSKERSRTGKKILKLEHIYGGSFFLEKQVTQSSHLSFQPEATQCSSFTPVTGVV